MIKIVKIKELPQGKAVIEVDQNGVLIPHISTIHLVYKYHFEEGQTLSNSDYKTFIKDNEFDQLYERSLHYISYQMRTISEVKKHLRLKTKEESVIDSVVQELKKNHYLSDQKYVEEYVSEKLLYDTVGPMYIKEKLIQKGIHFDLIDAQLIRYTEQIEYGKIEDIIQKEIRFKLKKPYQKVIESLKRKCIQRGFHLNVIDSSILSFKEDIQEMIDEDELIQKDVKNLQKQYKNPSYDDTQKMIQKLLSKGYSYDVIKKHIK